MEDSRLWFLFDSDFYYTIVVFGVAIGGIINLVTWANEFEDESGKEK